MAMKSLLQKELQQSRPFASRAEEAVLATLRTADTLRRWYAQFFTPHDLTLQQYNVLRILRGAGDEALPTLEIGRRMVEEAHGITRLIDNLEGKGWVVRQRSSEDRRLVRCGISPAGLKVLADLDESVNQSAEGNVAGLTEAELGLLIHLLERVRSPKP